MGSPRRLGTEESKTRGQLLDAAEQLMLDEGYAAVTSRRVAAQAGLKPQLVHYYFRSMDDLFLAAFQRRAERGLERHAKALASDQPLRAIWKVATDPHGTALTLEYAALANHRKTIRTEIAHYAARFRELQVDALTAALVDDELPDGVSPLVLHVVMTGLTQVLAMEDGLGITAGHAETVTLVERLLDEFEPKQA